MLILSCVMLRRSCMLVSGCNNLLVTLSLIVSIVIRFIPKNNAHFLFYSADVCFGERFHSSIEYLVNVSYGYTIVGNWHFRVLCF